MAVLGKFLPRKAFEMQKNKGCIAMTHYRLGSKEIAETSIILSYYNPL